MYRIISKTLGSIRVEGKLINQNGSILISKMTDEIICLQQEKLIKVKEIKDKVKKEISVSSMFEDKNEDNNENKNKRKKSGGN